MDEKNEFSDAPGDAPRQGRVVYGYLVIVALCAGALGYGLGQVPVVVHNASEACSAVRVCTPLPATAMPPIDTWQSGGETWTTALGGRLETYQSQNPNYDVTFVHDQDDSRKDFWGHVTYHKVGHFVATPHWSVQAQVAQWYAKLTTPQMQAKAPPPAKTPIMPHFATIGGWRF